MPLQKKLMQIFRKKGLTLSLAESCTGGLLSARLTQVGGSSKYYKGGIICYSDKAKTEILGIKKKTLEKSGAVSSETALEMCKRAAEKFKSDLALSITGVAGPSGGTEEKPVGLVYFGLFRQGETFIFKRKFSGSRRKIQNKAVNFALYLLSKYVKLGSARKP